MRICLRCESDVWWHLNPFSSRHCFWHISQYHRNFCKPLALMRFEMALGEKKSCLGIFFILLLLQAAAGVRCVFLSSGERGAWWRAVFSTLLRRLCGAVRREQFR